jgi:hypothetical protein
MTKYFCLILYFLFCNIFITGIVVVVVVVVVVVLLLLLFSGK